MLPWIFFCAVGCGVFGLLFGALECGYRWGRRARHAGNALPQLGAMQGATLGLLGLLLGFSFSGASSRFIERQDIIVREANALGTAFLRADLLAESHRAPMRDALLRYGADRIRLFEAIGDEETAATLADLARDHAAAWATGVAAAQSDRSVMMAILPPLNDMADLLADRNAAAGRHLPRMVLGLLVACSAISLALLGYGCGRDGARQFAGAGALAFLVASALWVTIDMDNPRFGIIRVNDEPLRAIQRTMSSAHP